MTQEAETVETEVKGLKSLRDMLGHNEGELRYYSRQKSYADPRRKDVEFVVDDYVFLKVSPMKGVMRFGKEGKLPPRHIGPLEVIDRVGIVTDQLELSPSLSHVHPVFHIFMLRKYISDPSNVLQPDTVELKENLTFEEQPIAIVDFQMRQLWSK
ncbi:uncharacterized protein LOC131182872 [Hevea brasiliensis]|uniref:uncharacterized protein LOC131182872 n=1 Tax=Hevea brasiliensis TaxID=3981 RepID=UPI0025F9B7E9|nr:uncharacterized protein LOC131182872 [Hevea brasiliensis]